MGKSVQQQTELVHRIELSDSLAWRGGLSFLDQSFQMSEDAEIDQRRNTKAIHGSFDWRPSDSIEWSAGIRAEDHSSYENPVIGSLSTKWALQEGFALHGRKGKKGFRPLPEMIYIFRVVETPTLSLKRAGPWSLELAWEAANRLGQGTLLFLRPKWNS